MNFLEAIASAFLNFVTWQGRSSRSEYWYFQLFMLIPVVVVLSLGKDALSSPLTLIFFAIVIIPNISLGVRRLHDTNRSGWWWWSAIIPVIGPLIWLIFMIWPGNDENNDYGQNPLKAQW